MLLLPFILTFNFLIFTKIVPFLSSHVDDFDSFVVMEACVFSSDSPGYLQWAARGCRPVRVTVWRERAQRRCSCRSVFVSHFLFHMELYRNIMSCEVFFWVKNTKKGRWSFFSFFYLIVSWAYINFTLKCFLWFFVFFAWDLCKVYIIVK